MICNLNKSFQIKMEDGDRKRIICVVGFLYEWGFTKCIGDDTKQGFVSRKLKDGTLFDCCDEMITELESKLENFTGENLDLLTEIISSYKNNGVNKTFLMILCFL